MAKPTIPAVAVIIRLKKLFNSSDERLRTAKYEIKQQNKLRHTLVKGSLPTSI
jgi:hypothetical protein